MSTTVSLVVRQHIEYQKCRSFYRVKWESESDVLRLNIYSQKKQLTPVCGCINHLPADFLED